MKAFWPQALDFLQNPVLLGSGQYGLVYQAKNTRSGRKVAVKVIEAGMDRDSGIIKRFKREIRAMQRIESDRIVKIFDYWIEPHFIAFEMEYIEGLPLNQLMRRLSGIDFQDRLELVLSIMVQVCEGLDDLHEHNLIHRDLKPSNILIALPENGSGLEGTDLLNLLQQKGFGVKISDLGLVKDLSASFS
ncbi:MAG: serine/threonine-protein kinase, partial [Calditrichia bacterium]